ncbi:VanZ family protein [Schinkia sp. CFF1]
MSKDVRLNLYLSQILFIVLLPIWLKLTQYLHPLVIGIVWFCLTSFILIVSLLVKEEKMNVSKQSLDLIVFFYSIGLLILLFFRPENRYYGAMNLIPFNTVLFYLSGRVAVLITIYNLAANIGLFIPFGLYYCFVNHRLIFTRLLLISCFSILMIEGIQFVTKRGSFDIDDVILNVFGVCLGYWLYPLIGKAIVIKAKKHLPG